MTDRELFLKYNFVRNKGQTKSPVLIKQIQEGIAPFDLMDVSQPDKVSILLCATYACNANCNYCENKHLTSHFKNSTLPKEKVTALLEKFNNHINQIIIIGGEALLLPDDFFIHLNNERKRLKGDYKIVIQTNSILMSEEKHKFLSSLDIGWNTSFNGMHNTESRGEQSTEAALSAIQDYRKTFISVYGTNTYKNLIPNYEFYKSLGVTGFQSAVMRSIKDEEGLPQINDDLELVYKYIDYWIHDTKKPIKDVWIARQIERVLGFASLCEHVNCIGSWVTVDPDGNLTHCGYNSETKSHIYCNIDEVEDFNDFIDNEKFLKLCNQQKELVKTNCQGCEWYPVCNGGCMKCNFTYDETFSTVDPEQCIFNQNILNYITNLIMDIDLSNKYLKYNPIFIQLLKENCYFSLKEIKIIEKYKI